MPRLAIGVLRCVLLAAVAAVIGQPAAAAAPTGAGGAVVTVSASPSRASVPAGGRLVIAVTLDHAEHWHTWPSVDQDVLPKEIAEFAIRTAITPVGGDPPSLGTPAGWLGTRGKTQWPTPEPALVADPNGGADPISLPTYQGKAVAFVPVTLSESLAPGRHTLGVIVGFQACNDKTCEAPEEVPLSVTIEVTSGGDAAAREAWLADGPSKALFAPFKPANFTPPPPALPTPSDPQPTATEPSAATNTKDLKVDAFGLGFTISDAGSALGTTLVILVALLGGFILNLTPCVLPMIPLKILGLSQAAKDPKKSLFLGIVMCLGVVFFWIVIGACIAFIQGFDDVSTLFQLWWFVLGIGLFIGAMAVGMLGLFTVGLPKWVYMVNPSQDTVRGSFIFGIMTAVLATPCIAPFLGTAVAWATRQTPAITLLAFLAVGTGMALPYLILAANPKWVDKVPKSGPASEVVKQVMGLLMLAVAAFFIGSAFLSLSADVPYIWQVLHWWIATVFAACAAFWLALRTFQLSKSGVKRAVFSLVALVLVGGIGWWTMRLTDLEARVHAQELAAKEKSEQNGEDAARFWVRYTPTKFEQAIARGDVVVLDFTASWCLTCKALKAAVLSREEVETALQQPGVTSLLADLSSRHDPGWEKLRALGRKGIPLLAVFGPGTKEPWISDAYTVDQVLTAIRAAKGSAGGSRAESSGNPDLAAGRR